MTSAAVFNFFLQRWVLGKVTADELAALVDKGTLTQDDSDEIRACIATDWAGHKR